MFEINEAVIHYREGLSTIIGINQINGVDYFLLRVNKVNAETIYVPIDTASNIIRPIMSEKEADAVLKYIKGIKKDYNPNTKQRRDLFKKKLNSGDTKELSYLFRQNYLYKKHPDEVRLGPVDLDMLNYATNNFLDEFSLTYNIPRNQIEEFVCQKFN